MINKNYKKKKLKIKIEQHKGIGEKGERNLPKVSVRLDSEEQRAKNRVSFPSSLRSALLESKRF